VARGEEQEASGSGERWIYGEWRVSCVVRPCNQPPALLSRVRVRRPRKCVVAFLQGRSGTKRRQLVEVGACKGLSGARSWRAMLVLRRHVRLTPCERAIRVRVEERIGGDLPAAAGGRCRPPPP